MPKIKLIEEGEMMLKSILVRTDPWKNTLHGHPVRNLHTTRGGGETRTVQGEIRGVPEQVYPLPLQGDHEQIHR